MALRGANGGIGGEERVWLRWGGELEGILRGKSTDQRTCATEKVAVVARACSAMLRKSVTCHAEGED